jgi:hypothetical protein
VFKTEFDFDEPMLTMGFAEQFPDQGDGHNFSDPARQRPSPLGARLWSRQVHLGVKKRKKLFVFTDGIITAPA